MSAPRLLVIQHLGHDHLHELAGPLVDAGFAIDTWCTFLDDEPPELDGDLAAVVSMGGDESAYDQIPFIARERELLVQCIADDVPVLGVCFGAQLLAIAAGGRGFPAARHEIGWSQVEYAPEASDDRIGRILQANPNVFQFHYDTFALPEHAVLLGQTDGLVEAFRVGRRAWGLQFHLEAGPGLIYNWLGSYAEELRRKAVDTEAIRRDTEAYWQQYRSTAWAVAEEFVRAALE